MSAKSVLFIVSQSFQVVMPEDAEAGEPSEIGFDFEKEAYTAAELLDYMKLHGFDQPSSSPLTSRRDWISAPPIQDDDFFRLGKERSISLHVNAVRDHEGRELDEYTADALWVRLLGSHLSKQNQQDFALSA